MIKNTKPKRLQIGMSKPGAIPNSALNIFFDKSWINLGDAPLVGSSHEFDVKARKGLKVIIKKIVRRLSFDYNQKCLQKENAIEEDRKKMQELQRSPYFLPFWWDINSKLAFSDDTFNLIYSEHFFEHIWPDEAFALFKECYRVLGTNSVLRISVPDADLRVYEAPEPIGFDTATFLASRRGWGPPEVHKTRWNIYLLRLLLELAGFNVRPILYCDKNGRYINDWPSKNDKFYPKGVDWAIITSKQYILRQEKSLIVDALKN
jgi:predicted SAM-dependent methyltransferase